MAPAEGGLYAEQDVWSRQQMLAGEELLLPPLPPPKITVRVRHEADKYRVNLTREEAPAHVVYPHVLRCVSTWSARAGRGEGSVHGHAPIAATTLSKLLTCLSCMQSFCLSQWLSCGW